MRLTDNSNNKTLTDIWDVYFKPDDKVQKQQLSFSPFRSCRGAAPVWRHESASRQVIPIRILKGCHMVRGVAETESVAEVKEMCVCSEDHQPNIPLVYTFPHFLCINCSCESNLTQSWTVHTLLYKLACSVSQPCSGLSFFSHFFI